MACPFACPVPGRERTGLGGNHSRVCRTARAAWDNRYEHPRSSILVGSTRSHSADEGTRSGFRSDTSGQEGGDRSSHPAFESDVTSRWPSRGESLPRTGKQRVMTTPTSSLQVVPLATWVTSLDEAHPHLVKHQRLIALTTMNAAPNWQGGDSVESKGLRASARGLTGGK